VRLKLVAERRERRLLGDDLEAAVVDIGDQQPRGVGADVDAGGAQGLRT
jgi:hypothetical protein